MTISVLAEETIARIADRIEERMGPLFGSPEYLADPIKRARAEKRRREGAEIYARIAYEEGDRITQTAALREALEEAIEQLALMAKDPQNNPLIKQLRQALSHTQGEG